MTDAGFYIDSPDTRRLFAGDPLQIYYRGGSLSGVAVPAHHTRGKIRRLGGDYPDHAGQRRHRQPFGRGERVDSIHQFLRDYMALQKQRLTEFSQPGRWVYTARFFCEKTAQWSDLGHFFTFYYDCLDACREEIRKDSPGRGKIGR